MPEEIPQEWRKLSLILDEWLAVHQNEWFTREDIYHFLKVDSSPVDIAKKVKLVVAQILNYRASVAPTITLKKENRKFRTLENKAPIVNWKHSDPNSFFQMKWPFELEKYVKLPKRCVVVIGGVSNQGKTTFVHNIINLNWQKHKIALFDSENSPEELHARFANYHNYMSWPDDLVRDRTKNFSDCIEPDYINIIDYLEVSDNFYTVGKDIRDMRDALGEGIAVIVLQKSEGSILPVGGQFTRQLPRMVVTIDKEKLILLKGKARMEKSINPNNMRWSFQLSDDGAYFINVKRDYGLDPQEW